jgi:transposase-like protein
MGTVVVSCPLCQSSRVRIAAQELTVYAFACVTCNAQFTVTSENVVEVERRKVPRERSASSARLSV